MSTNCLIVQRYLNIIAGHGYISLINEVTRSETRDAILNESCIDHILTKNVFNCQASVLHNKISNHFSIVLSINTQTIRNNQNTIMIRNRIKHDEVREKLLEFNANTLTDISLIAVTHYLQQVYKDCTVICSNNSKHDRPSWLTADILTTMKKRDAAYKRYRRARNNPVLLNHYKALRNVVNRKVKQAKFNDIHRQLTEAALNPLKTWKIINTVLNKPPKQSQDSKVFRSLSARYSEHEVPSQFARVFFRRCRNNSSYLCTAFIEHPSS